MGVWDGMDGSMAGKRRQTPYAVPYDWSNAMGGGAPKRGSDAVLGSEGGVLGCELLITVARRQIG